MRVVLSILSRGNRHLTTSTLTSSGLNTTVDSVTATSDSSRAPRLHLAMHSQRWPSELVVVLDQLHNCEGKKFNCVGGF